MISRSSIDNEVSQLERKMRMLLGDFQRMQVEMNQLKDENRQLKRRLEEKDEQIGSFQNKIKISTIADSFAGNENTEDVREQIDEYIRDIDKCIAYLST